MNTNRFLNVARWNFAINRAQYFKLALSLFLAMAVPFLLFVLKSIWMTGITHSTEAALYSLPGTDMGPWMGACFVFAMPILCGYTFHNLLTKQTRIKELTLPASNGEKFLFHALVTVGGSFLAYVVSFFAIDILQYFYVGVVYGFSNAQWVPYQSIIISENEGIWLAVILVLSWIAFFSTFVLGNALKYRHNVLWTYVFHMAFSFLLFLVLGLTMPLLLQHGDWQWLEDFDPDKAGEALKWFAVLFFSLVTLFCWWQSYRLYCRAQITTKRNK